MKNQLLVAIAISMMVVSCKKEAEQESTDEMKENVPAAQVSPVEECYEFTEGKDTILAKLKVLNETVTGDLSYKLYQKDKNEGTLEGKMSGDTLFADYKFMSEGVASVRQVTFLKANETMTEGYGDVEEKEGKMVFKEKAKINYVSKSILRKVVCK